MKYNGWTNYETWLAYTHLTNEEGIYNYWRDEARVAFGKACTEQEVREKAREAARYDLAKQLKDEFEEANPLAEKPSFYADLLAGALSDTNWSEVAKQLINEVA